MARWESCPCPRPHGTQAGAPEDNHDEDWLDWMGERYGNPSECRDESLTGIEIEKRARLSDAERERNDWARCVFALGKKAVSSALTEEEVEILRRKSERKTRLGARPVNEPGQNVDATGNPHAVAASFPSRESAWD